VFLKLHQLNNTFHNDNDAEVKLTTLQYMKYLLQNYLTSHALPQMNSLICSSLFSKTDMTNAGLKRSLSLISSVNIAYLVIYEAVSWSTGGFITGRVTYTDEFRVSINNIDKVACNCFSSVSHLLF